MLHQLPEQAIQGAQKTINHLYGNRSSIGIVLPGMNNSELSYFFLKEVNQLLNVDYKEEICFYSLTKNIPVLLPYTSVYSVFDITKHFDSIIATDPFSYLKLNLSPSKRKFYYIFDPILLKISNALDKMDRTNITFIVRNKDHDQLARKELGIKPINTYVPNCNIDILRNIIHGR